MSNRIIRVAPLQAYSFSSTGRPGDLQTIVLGPRAIDSANAVSGVLQVAVSAQTIDPGATIQVLVVNALVIPEIPQQVFTTPGANLGFVTVDSSVPAGATVLTQIATPIGQMLQVLMAFDSGTSGAGNASLATIRTDIILRDA